MDTCQGIFGGQIRVSKSGIAQEGVCPVNIFDRKDQLIQIVNTAKIRAVGSLDEGEGELSLPLVAIEEDRTTDMVYSANTLLKQQHHYTVSSIVSAQNVKAEAAKRSALAQLTAVEAALRTANIQCSFKVNEKSYHSGTLGSQKAAGTEAELIVYDTAD